MPTRGFWLGVIFISSLRSGGLSAQAQIVAGPWPVVITEIHYHPPEGVQYEFVELQNTGDDTVDVGLWSFSEGVRCRLPPETVIPPGGRLVVCGFPFAVAERYALVEEQLIGWDGGSLDNSGDRITLVDALGIVVDEVRYDDQLPWAPGADGDGPSLQRICLHSMSGHWSNWSGNPSQEPTPLAPNVLQSCPPPAAPVPRVAINEIHYHPPGSLTEPLEYIELVNTTAEAVDLLGYTFSQGIEFEFEDSILLDPGGFLLVCRNESAAREAFGVTATVGDYSGVLSNGGERLTLLDASGNLVDSVRYEDSGDWPVGADQLGFSLEKFVPDALSDDPRSWIDSGSTEAVPDTIWHEDSVEGSATSSRLYFFLLGPGEILLDGVTLVDTSQPETNLLSNGTFDTGTQGWEFRGNHGRSRWSRDPGGTIFEQPALHVISDGRGTGSANSVTTLTVTALDTSAATTYRVTFSYAYLRGSPSLVTRLSGASASSGLYQEMAAPPGGRISPAARNYARQDRLPPFISRAGHFPLEPTSRDPTFVVATVRGADDVQLHVRLADGDHQLEMHDDGLAHDGSAGDGVYGVELPPQPHDTPVTFRIQASSGAGMRMSPLPSDPMTRHGYYVNDNAPPSRLPVFHLLLPTSNPRNYINSLACDGDNYGACAFAFRGTLYSDVGIRRRGQSVCGVLKKFLKLKFPRGHDFQRQHKVDLQSLYTDKSLTREHMAWEAFRETGQADCTHEYVRVHVNGNYFGLYAAMEHPDARFLERNGLQEEGNLYKATNSRETVNGTYEEETNEDGDMSDLRDFLNDLHAAPAAELVEFFGERMDEDAVIEYQATHVIINNRDYPHKNHFLFHDTERDRWSVVAWDVDLTFGKRWDGSNLGVLNDLMDNPGIHPWYTTTVRGGNIGNHLLDKFFAQAGFYYRRAYLTRLWDIIHERYTIEFHDGKLARLHDLLYEEQLEDIAVWGRSGPSPNDPTAPAEFEPNIERVRTHVALHRDYLLRYLQETERFSGHDRLKITEIMYNPTGTDDAEYLELWNNSGRAVDLSGWTIEGLGAPPQVFTFLPGTVVEDSEVFVIARDVGLFHARYDTRCRVFGPYAGSLSNNGELLRVKDAGPGHPATVDLVPYGTSGDWPDAADGLNPSLELTEVSADRDNDLGAHWRASLVPGGTPGFIEGITPKGPIFRRGDPSGEGLVDITDAIRVLIYLFLGGSEPPCLVSADMDGSGEVLLNDAIYLLEYMFLEGSAPPPPYPDCGPGEDPGSLGCLEYTACGG